MRPLQLPWTPRTMPHFIVDINRECNISCAACYNRRQFTKSLAAIARDVEAAAAQRELHTVTIAGGEPTLHPELPAIVRMLRDRGLRSVLLSNGLELDGALLAALKAAGLDLLLLHIDSGQTRPDLPAAASPAGLDALRREKIGAVGAQGIDVGLVATIYRHDLDDVNRLVDLVLESSHAHFLLATACWDPAPFARVTGTLAAGFRVAGDGTAPAAVAPGAPCVTLAEIRELLAARGLHPFGTIGSSADPRDPRWLCYTSAAVHAGRRRHASLASGLSDRLLVRLARRVGGRHIYYVKRNARRFRAQLLLNAFSGGRCAENLGILLAAAAPGSRLLEKRLVFQSGPTLGPRGEVVYCRHCPDATVIDGHLVPICISDGWVSAAAGP